MYIYADETTVVLQGETRTDDNYIVPCTILQG